MKVETRPLSTITPYARNPRKNAGLPVAKVKASLKEYGWRQPIVVDTEGVIIVGHTRYAAALELGWTDAPVHVAEGLTKAQVKAYRIADNRTGAEAEWDMDLLALEFDDLRDAGIDMELTGFDEDELTTPGEVGGEGDTEPDIDRAEELRVKWCVEYGDLWALGDHRLLCGDSTKAEDVGRLLGDDRPHLMVTDPPYGVEYDATWRDGYGEFGDGNAKMRGKVSNDDRADWREAWALFPGDVAYVWHASLFTRDVIDSLEACGFQHRAMIIWVKPSPVFGRGHYHWQHEPCWYVVKKSGTGHWQGDRTETTVWQIAGMNPAGRGKTSVGNEKTSHSTQKPLECMERPIRNNSAVGDLIYEPFSGSGTTIIAGENLKRKVRAMEISPAYVAVALQRWADHTGKTPTRL